MAGRNRNRNRNTNRRDRRLTQRAQTNVEMQDQSQVNLLQQQLQNAQQDYLRQRQAAQSIWGGGGEAIADMPRPQFGRIGQEYNQALGSVADLFGGVEGMPGAEVDAGNALGLAYGEAGNTMLANLDAREGLARSSASRQMDLAGRYAGDNVIQRMEDTIRGYNDQLGQVRADDPWQVSQEVESLKDQSLQEKLARSKMRSEAALSEWLQGYLGGGNNGNNRRNNGGDNGGNGSNYTDPNDRTPGPDQNPGPNVSSHPLPSTQYNPTVQDWRQRDARWGDLGRNERQRIRTKGLTRRPKEPPRTRTFTPPTPPGAPQSAPLPDWMRR